jgi:channel protein (hemolysin III family)
MIFEGDQFINKSKLHPRRPGVVRIDVALVLQALGVATIAPSIYSFGYCIVVVMMFSVSAFHHWLPDASWHYRLDRSMIYLLVAGTTLPYVPQILFLDKVLGLWLLFFATVAGMLLKACGVAMQKGGWGTLLYLMVGSISVYVMLGVHELLGTTWALWFWGSVAGYVISMVIYNKSLPNMRWHRVAQHLTLVLPVTIGLWLPVFYLR